MFGFMHRLLAHPQQRARKRVGEAWLVLHESDHESITNGEKDIAYMGGVLECRPTIRRRPNERAICVGTDHARDLLRCRNASGSYFVATNLHPREPAVFTRFHARDRIWFT